MGDLTVEVTGQISMTSDKKITLKCGSSSIEINPSGITISTTQLQASGTATTQVSGGMTTVEASAFLTLQGTMVKINS